MLRAGLLIVVFLSLISPLDAWAQEDVGNVSVVVGGVELERAGATSTLTADAGIRMNDVVRTPADASARIVFVDQTVLFVAGNSEVRVDEMVYQPDTGSSRGALDLLRGKVRTFVSEHYEKPTAGLVVRTATATAGVRGTDFIVVFDGENLTDVAVVAGQVRVVGEGADAGSEVLVEAGQITQVRRGGQPSSPRGLSAAELGQLLSGVDADAPLGIGLDADAVEDDDDSDSPGPGAFDERGDRIRDGRRQLGDLLEGSPAVAGGGLRVEF
ncbi:MAG: hypothetical protein ACI8TX_002633 [Hyphomicrobiaceae bacterium]|jgi:hypothetical protein